MFPNTIFEINFQKNSRAEKTSLNIGNGNLSLLSKNSDETSLDSNNISQSSSLENIHKNMLNNNQSWMEDDTAINGKIKILCEEEVLFWKSLINKYLGPNEAGNREINRVAYSHLKNTFRAQIWYNLFLFNSLKLLMNYLI